MSPSEADIIRELVDHNEAGVALEILCSWMGERGLPVPECDKARLRRVAGRLGIALSRLEGLAV